MKHNAYWFNKPKIKENSLGIEVGSSFLFDQENLKKILKSMTLSSIELAKITNKIVNVNPYVYCVANSDSSYTDGQQIVIGMAPSSRKKDVFEGMDIEYGLACHEACHCAYTDFKFAEETFKKISDLCKWIHNVYEDECIEEMMGNKIPTYISFLNMVGDHYFNTSKFGKPTEDIDIIQIMLLAYVRAKDWVNLIPKQWQDKYGELFDNIYDVVQKYHLTNYNNFKYSPTKETFKAAVETEKLILDFLKIKPKNNKNNKSNNVNGPVIDMEGHDGLGGKNGAQDPNGIPGFGKRSEDEINGKLTNVQKQKGMIGKSTSESSTPKQLKQQIQQAVDAAKQSIQKEDEHKALAKEGKSLESVQTENQGELVTSSVLQKGSNYLPDIIDRKRFDLRNKYINTVRKYKREIELAKKIIFHNDIKIETQFEEFHRNGNLNSRQLAQAIQGVNTVYKTMVQKMVDKTNPRYNLVLLLDESASMYSVHDKVTDIAVILYEAMKDFKGINLYIYGHGELINRYIDPKTKFPYSLMDRRKQWCQDDFASTKAVIEEVRSKSNKPIFLISITDACYLSMDYKMYKLAEEAKECKVTLGNITFDSKCYQKVKNIHGIISKSNDEMYGKGNWLFVEDDPKSQKMLTIIQKFSKIVEKRYKLLK